MKLTNRQKHEIGVNLISGYMTQLGIDHHVVSNEPNIDITVPDQNRSIKVICNHSKSPSVKVGKDFEPQERVLYIVVSPTDKNRIGFTCRGGEKEEIEQSLISIPTADAPKNINVNTLPGISIRKRMSN